MKPCSRCGTEHDRKGQRYCLTCHAAVMRAWRKAQSIKRLACPVCGAKAPT